MGALLRSIRRTRLLAAEIHSGVRSSERRLKRLKDLDIIVNVGLRDSITPMHLKERRDDIVEVRKCRDLSLSLTKARQASPGGRHHLLRPIFDQVQPNSIKWRDSRKVQIPNLKNPPAIWLRAVSIKQFKDATALVAQKFWRGGWAVLLWVPCNALQTLLIFCVVDPMESSMYDLLLHIVQMESRNKKAIVKISATPYIQFHPLRLNEMGKFNILSTLPL